ncbi:hypothetical protein GS538_20655 [Rhodococcus hoagii]|nr:hypothetical protein [Prescottella equi]NKS69091.1 hypothetical protein [Prescottella equi]NKS98765.1 hypothetical protein [Prescottella equi]NKZ71985.1 hypothetical protein [Prescottella equi]
MIGDLSNRFDFHPANTPERQAAHEQVRAICRHAAEQLDALVPDSREKACAVTHIEEAMFWGNAGIARNATRENHP